MASDIPSPVRFFGSATKATEGNVDPFAAGATQAKNEPFWESSVVEDIQANWDKFFPYQLILLHKKGKKYQLGGALETFTLPIPPSAMSVSMPFAIQADVTMGGVIEQHNGAPIRMISLSGTTGVLPLRSTVARSQVLESGGSIFAGTVTGINQIGTAVSQASNGLGFDRNHSSNVVSDQELEGGVIRGTGFAQFQLLRRFLEAYAARKRAGEKDLRLGLAIWKEQEIYLCTPVNFDVIRNASAPLEYPYNLTLKSWRRISVKDQDAVGAFNGVVGARDPNKLAQIVNTLETGRRILEGARHVLEGVRADVQNILYTPLRQVLLGAKDAVGTILTAVDLPSNIISDLKEPLLEAAATAQGIQQLGRVGQRFQQNNNAAVNAVQEAFRQLAISSGKADTEAGTHGATPLPPPRPPARGMGQALFGSPGENAADPANKVAANPADNFAFFSTVRPSDLNLRPATISKIETERDRCKSFRREDYEQFRDDTLRVLADFSDFVGAGSSTYTTTYGLPKRVTNRVPTDDDWEVIHALSATSQMYDSMAASARINRDQVTSLDYVAGLATRSGIAFQVPRSKFAIPFPYGSTLEQLASRYLDEPNRWHEIAVLNGLRAPYVDEIGFKLSLLTNGIGNQITVSDGSNLFVGQKVWLASNTVQRETRRIQKLTKLGPTQWAVQLDGADDLGKFATIALAFLQAFLPGTVNSQQQIYIPSDTDPEEEDYRTKTIPGVDYFDPLVRSGGIDLLLTQSGDLVITPDGDSRLAIGLTNLIQKARLVLGTPKGALLHHPDYGIGLKPGTSTADLSASDIFQSIQQFFREDQGYSGVRGVAIKKDGGNLTVKMTVGIAGTAQVVPLEVNIIR